MKFGHLTEHNMRNSFLNNHTENAMGILFQNPFLKNQN